jgi:lipopolysaccharide export system permease protein
VKLTSHFIYLPWVWYNSNVILERYVLSEFLQPLAFGVVVFSFVLVLDKIFDMADLILNRGASTVMVFKMFAIFVPTILPLTIPMAFLLATLVTYGRFAQDGEITAVRASGLSLWRISWPILALAAAVSATLLPFNRDVTPRAHAYFREMFSQMAESDPLLQLEPRRFFEVQDLRLYAHGVDRVHQRMDHVIVYRMRTAGLPPDRIFSRVGIYERAKGSFKLNLEDGQFERYDAQDPGKLLHARFQTYRIDVPLGAGPANSSIDIHDMTSNELSKTLRGGQAQSGLIHELESEIELRHAIALAPLALGILGIPIGMALERGGKTMGFGATAAVLFGYYLALVLGLSLAERGKCPAEMSVWMANLLCMGGGVVLFRRMLSK